MQELRKGSEPPNLLREELMLGNDYIPLTPQQWSYLHEWYGGGPEILREVRSANMSALAMLPLYCARVFSTMT